MLELLRTIGGRKIELRWRLVWVVRRAGRSGMRRLLVHSLWWREALEVIAIRCRLPHWHGGLARWWKVKRLALMRWTLSEGRTIESVVSEANLAGEVSVVTAFPDSENILVEFFGNFSNGLEVTRLDHDVGTGLVILVTSEGNCALKGVANLASIPSRSYRAFVLVLLFEKDLREIDQSLRVTIHFHWRLASTTNQVPPDFPGSRPVQRWIV